SRWLLTIGSVVRVRAGEPANKKPAKGGFFYLIKTTLFLFLPKQHLPFCNYFENDGVDNKLSFCYI
ncbi:MAG TPA: hypothetical protein P5294_08435, partial [Smithellaceae bacterium]|nr:hypothetical protein [Smithellaceae bacterium]